MNQLFNNKIFSKKMNLFYVLFILMLSLIIIYSESLAGSQEFFPNDKISSMNVKEAISQSDNYPYWFPWMMGGLPSVHSAQNISDYYFPNYIMKGFHFIGIPWFWNYVFHLVFAGIGVYLLSKKLNSDKITSLFSSVAFIIMPYMTAMLVHGHGSQIMTISYMPWIFFGYLRLKDKSTLKNLGIFSLLVGLQLLRGHVQMAYYTWMMLGLYILIDIIYLIIKRKKDIRWIFYSFSGLILGVLYSLSLYVPILSYAPFSSRSSSIDGGMGLQAATEYSFSFGEITTFFIPSFYGFGNQTYWGSMTFTNFPNYMGIIILLFAIYGLIRYEWTRFKIFCIICSLLFLLLSFGGSFYEFCYYYLPFFSKFRNPMYLLIVVQFCVAILSGMGFKSIIQDVKERKSILPIYSTIFLIFLFIVPISMSSVISERVSYSIEKHDRDIYKNQLINYYNLGDIDADKYINSDEKISDRINQKNKLVQTMIKDDIKVLSIIVLICFILIISMYYLFPRFKASDYFLYFFSGLICIVMFFDVYLVNRKVMYPERIKYLFSTSLQEKYEDFYDKRGGLERIKILHQKTDYSSESDVIKTLKKYKEEGHVFRIFDESGMWTSNEWARYHIECINGYHPAELDSYSKFAKLESDFFLKMMNVKYRTYTTDFIDFKGLDRAFFIKQLLSDNDNNETKRFELYKSELSPSEYSYITGGEKNLKTTIDFIDSDLGYSYYNFNINNSGDKVTHINKQNPNKIIIKVNTSAPQFLAISEIYYPNGWYASVDGKNVEIFEINDLIRGVFIDNKGEHTIKMWYDPLDLKWGRSFSWLAFILIFGLIFSNKLKFLYEMVKK